MNCLKPETIILFNQKALRATGAGLVLNRAQVNNLRSYVEATVSYHGFDELETFRLAAYLIVKQHNFRDGNKRTAQHVLLNCLRQAGWTYTGRPIDLARKIVELSKSKASRKTESILELSYFLKSNLQKRQ
ncbi:death-on-curing family protein [Desulfatibacillum aliphaticivorans]|uniref:Death-on-curing family protein n=1 Tax=Desulfatibacillum aliphaticivorans TaxID=218208 RepID=B8FFL5_DESAL|nr:Fic family protein [Desulfatibacillum aliphaticivorans]ACL04275.1 death-on-curing family protein [Desulfatibacillum aliphaticivorans]